MQWSQFFSFKSSLMILLQALQGFWLLSLNLWRHNLCPRLKIFFGWEIPGDPVVRTPQFHCRGQETKVPCAAWYGQKKFFFYFWQSVWDNEHFRNMAFLLACRDLALVNGWFPVGFFGMLKVTYLDPYHLWSLLRVLEYQNGNYTTLSASSEHSWEKHCKRRPRARWSPVLGASH